MAQNSFTTQELKSIYFPGSSNKQTIKYYIKHQYVQDSSYNKVTVQAFVATSSKSWNIGQWTDYGSYLKIGSDNREYKQNVPSGTVLEYKLREETFNLSNKTSSATIEWKFGHNPSSWLGDSSWNRPSGSFTISMNVAHTVSYNANGGSGAPGAQTKIYGTNLTLSSTVPTRSGYSFAGWNTNSSGTGTNYAAGATYSSESDVTLYAKWSQNTSSCGTPTSIAVSQSSTNTVKCSCVVGSNGTGNSSTGVDFYVTFDGTTPTTSNYHYTTYVTGNASTTVNSYIYLTNYSQATWEGYFGTDCIGTVKAIARTRGAAGSSYYSGTTSVASNTSIAYKGAPKAPAVITSPKGKVIKGKHSSDSCYVAWNTATAGVNDTIGSYTVYVYNASTDALVTSYNTGTTRYKYVPNSVFTAGNTYYFKVRATSAASGLYVDSLTSGLAEFKNITSFSLPPITVTNAGTVPTTNINGEEAFLNIGTGDVLKISWPKPTASNNEISSYYIEIYPSENDPYYTEDANGYFNYWYGGNVNEVYIPAAELNPGGPGIHKFTIYFDVYSKFGHYYSANDSNFAEYTFVNNCHGAYIKLDREHGYPQPVMKRAVAFVKDPASGEWKLCQGAFHKNPAGEWKTGDISYEVLMDQNGEIITDSSNEPIYTL